MYFCMVLTMIASLFAGFKVVGAEKKKETERNASILRNHQAMMQRRASDHSDQVLSDQGAYEERLSVYQSYVLLNQKRAWQRTILTEINSILLRTQKRIA
jgi:Tfp pilus assembly protein PilN